MKRRAHEPAPSLDPGDLPVAVTRGETERAGLEALAGRACLAALSGGRLRLGRGALFGASHARLDGKLAASRGRAPPSLSPSPSPPRAPRRRRRPRRRAAQHARRRGLPGWWRSGGAWPGRQPRLLLPRRLEGTRRCSRVLAARLRLVDRRLALLRLVGLGGRALGRAGRRADHGSRLARAGAARARPAVRARSAAVERRREAARPSPNPQAAPCARVRHRAREAADAEGRRAREACGRVSGTCQRGGARGAGWARGGGGRLAPGVRSRSLSALKRPAEGPIQKAAKSVMARSTAGAGGVGGGAGGGGLSGAADGARRRACSRPAA